MCNPWLAAGNKNIYVPYLFSFSLYTHVFLIYAKISRQGCVFLLTIMAEMWHVLPLYILYMSGLYILYMSVAICDIFEGI